MSARDDRPRVLVLGGGFGGLGAALELRKADADVVLVDRHDYHTFQPLLYQLASGLLGTEWLIANPGPVIAEGSRVQVEQR